MAGPGTVSHAWTYTVALERASLDVRDPDGLVQEARWFSLEQATAALRRLPYRPLSEPAVALLGGRVASGGHWSYADPGSEPLVTFPHAEEASS